MPATHRKERIDRPVKARSDDIFALSSTGEALYLVLPRMLPVLIIMLIPLIIIPLGEIYWAKVMVLTGVIAIMALSWDLMFSVGLISLGQGLFFGIGGYIAGILNNQFGLSPALTIPLATILGGLVSTLLLTPVLRLRGIYFAMITLALSLICGRVVEATGEEGIFGGTAGLTALSPLPNIWVEVYIVLIVVVILLFGFRRLINTDYGVVLRGIGENDRAVMSNGININWYKMQVLFIGSAATAFAGAFMTHNNMQVGMGAFALNNSLWPVASVVVGGSGSFAGAALGAFILVPISELLRSFVGLQTVFYCLIMVGFVVGLPEGIFHYIQRRYHQLDRKVDIEVKK